MIGMAMKYIGFHLDDDSIEKLKVISFITKKDRSILIREGIGQVIEQNKDAFDKFYDFVKNMKH